MTILKCKMCGGDIEINSDQTYGTCESCGSTMTLPKAADERKANLFNRANHFRRQNEFDKALSAYENILNEDNTDAEAHWGVVLSRYGIEYVEDPRSHEMVPTCHRVHSSSFLADFDYLAALQYTEDGYTKSLYEEEAKKINSIQKEILAISNKEDPFDIFICYKETTAGGSRTKDSVLAQEIYYQLIDENFKVFFSRITLEEKLGAQYEPYIYAALHSAKVMLVIGTKPEHFNAVWVKNEWSRFLALIKEDRDKVLIPCYKDMNVYDLPEELSMLQSQDMAKLGFAQDLIHGIKKIVAHANASEVGTSGFEALSPGVAQLLDRASIFSEEGYFDSAYEYYDRILDLEPRNAKIYFMKLLATLKMRKEEEIVNSEKPLTDFTDFQNAVKFADEDYKKVLERHNQAVIERLENLHIDNKYKKAITLMTSDINKYDLLTAYNLFNEIIEYKDSRAMIEKCKILAEERRLEEDRKEAERREREARYQEYCKTYEKQLKTQDFIAKLKKDKKGLEGVLRENPEDRKYILECIREDEEKIEQFEEALANMPPISPFGL